MVTVILCPADANREHEIMVVYAEKLGALVRLLPYSAANKTTFVSDDSCMKMAEDRANHYLKNREK